MDLIPDVVMDVEEAPMDPTFDPNRDQALEDDQSGGTEEPTPSSTQTPTSGGENRGHLPGNDLGEAGLEGSATSDLNEDEDGDGTERLTSISNVEVSFKI